MDFTRKKYRQLLEALVKSGIPFSLRHDVDKRPYHSLALAKIETEMGIHAVYYFRCVPCSNNPDVIRQIVALGHEIGYHYEDMSLCHGDTAAAIAHFEKWLKYFRQFYPIQRICMHGAPTSQYDGKDLWKHYDYHDFGINYEPYFDEDYTKTFYLTDTGRCWDGYKVSVRDKVSQQEQWNQQGLTFHTTDQIIRWLKNPSPLTCSAKGASCSEASSKLLSIRLADRSRLAEIRTFNFPLSTILITTHPQRWTDSPIEWLQELLMQSFKNSIKRIIVCLRKS